MSCLGSLGGPVFILGCPRSGTTFLGTILGALPKTSYYYEPAITKYFSRLVYQQKAPRWQSWLFFQAALRSLLFFTPGRGSTCIEKNPPYTFITETLSQIFPQARFIYLLRDGRDVTVSLLGKPWHLERSSQSGMREPGGYRYGPYPHFYIEPERESEYRRTSDVHRCIWIWRRYCEAGEHLAAQIHHSKLLSIRYEDLIRSKESSVDKLAAFLCVDDSKCKRILSRAVDCGYESSVGKWRKHLAAEELQVVEQEAGQLLRRLGYGP
jgi:hypothetical protein